MGGTTLNMKILAKIKKRPLILGILFAMLIIGIVYAAESYRVNSGTQVTINEWSVCKKVTNNNALAIFVPTKTAAEWTAFRTNASGVTFAECVYCQDADGDGYGVCPNCGIANGCTYNGNDCCDTDSGSYPGAGYHSSTNNCGSWDWDCNGTISKSDCTLWTNEYSYYTCYYSNSACTNKPCCYNWCEHYSSTPLNCGGTGTDTYCYSYQNDMWVKNIANACIYQGKIACFYIGGRTANCECK